MSTIIRGYTVRSNCYDCILRRKDGKMCCAFVPTPHAIERGTDRLHYHRSVLCPLIPLPENHGRLIDADAVIQGLRDGLAEIARKNGKDIEPENVYVQTTIRLLNAAPTIVEAEGST